MRLRPDRRTPHDPSPPPAQHASASSRPAAVRKALLAVLTTGLALAMSGLTAQPAAAVPGIQDVQESSPHDTRPTKQVIANCPTGTVGVGVSGVHNTTSDARITQLLVNPNGVAVTASLEQGSTQTAPWRLFATARCAPTSSLPGLEYKVAGSGLSSEASQKVRVLCSSGKQVIGLGGQIQASGQDADRELMLTTMRPVRGDGVLVRGNEDETGFSGNWQVGVIAVCADPLPGREVVRDTTQYDSASRKFTRAICPEGTQVHSLGFDVSTAQGEAHVFQAFLSSGASSDPRQAAALQANEDRTGYSGRWRLQAIGICAN